MTQLGVVNAIARPVPMGVIQFILYETGHLPLIPLIISTATGVFSMWWLYFQSVSNGAVRGLQNIKGQELLTPNLQPCGDQPKWNSPITSLAWAPDGKSILLGFSDGYIAACKFEVREEKGRRKGTFEQYFRVQAHRKKPVNDCCFSKYGEFAATCGVDGAVVVWRTSQEMSGLDRSKKYKLEADHSQHGSRREREVMRVKFSPDTHWVASGCEKGELIVWQWNNGKYKDEQEKYCHFEEVGQTSRGTDEIVVIGWNKDSTRCIAISKSGRMKIVEINEDGGRFKSNAFNLCESGQSVYAGEIGYFNKLKLDRGKNNNLESPDREAQFVAIVSKSKGNDGTQSAVFVHNLSKGEQHKMTLFHGNPVGMAAICPDLQHCITTASSCKLWNIQTGECIGSGQMRVNSMDQMSGVLAQCGGVHPGGRWVAIGAKIGLSVFDFRNKYSGVFKRSKSA